MIRLSRQQNRTSKRRIPSPRPRKAWSRRRAVANGELTLIERHFTGNLPIHGLESLGALAYSPDGEYLYAVSSNDDSLAVFETPLVVFKDGFENGTTSAWSATQP